MRIASPPPAAAIALLALLHALAPAHARAQEPDSAVVPVDSVIITPPVPVTAVPVEGDPTPEQPLSPRGAFIRSMILPGWGQAAFESYVRGGVFFAGWAGNWFMNFKNAVRLDDAEDRYARARSQIRELLLAASDNPDSLAVVLENTDLLDAAVRADGEGNKLRKLVRARKEQREDWIAWTLFWIFASGVDGYVTAHLADFPATLDVDPARQGGVSLRIEVPLGRREP